MVCSKVNNVHFIIGGDGPKKLLLEEMREQYSLHDRIELLGAVPHHKVRDVLVRAHIFLNCSLTEAFCIALLEAASCGLFVVSTKVGGVPEVLPPSMIKFAEPDVESLYEAIVEAISISRRIVPAEMHERVKNMYHWTDVAKRTEVVYNNISTARKASLGSRLIRYSTIGPFSGFAMCCIVAWLHILWKICEFVWPSGEIEFAANLVLPGVHAPSPGSSPLSSPKLGGGSGSLVSMFNAGSKLRVKSHSSYGKSRAERSQQRANEEPCCMDTGEDSSDFTTAAFSDNGFGGSLLSD
jgi:phosphatidylinositol glycan class A protein